ncbi:MAG: DUF5615 family PIN-like protein [Planctomycetota bacterium]
MKRVLLDENLGRGVADCLRAEGFDVTTLGEAGLRAASDDAVFAYARSDDRILVTLDLDFSNVHRFALGGHAGIVVGRFRSDTSPSVIGARLVEVFRRLTDADLRGNLVMVSPSLLRIRRYDLDDG